MKERLCIMVVGLQSVSNYSRQAGQASIMESFVVSTDWSTAVRSVTLNLANFSEVAK